MPRPLLLKRLYSTPKLRSRHRKTLRKRRAMRAVEWEMILSHDQRKIEAERDLTSQSPTRAELEKLRKIESLHVANGHVDELPFRPLLALSTQEMQCLESLHGTPPNHLNAKVLRKMKMTPALLKKIGYGAFELGENYSRGQGRKYHERSLGELRTIGYTFTDLLQDARTVSDLVRLGFTPRAIMRQGVGVKWFSDKGANIRQLLRAGFSLNELLKHVDPYRLFLAGFTPTQLRKAGCPVSKLKNDRDNPLNYFPNPRVFKSKGVTVEELFADYSISEIRRMGYTIQDFIQPRVSYGSDADLMKAGFSSSEIARRKKEVSK